MWLLKFHLAFSILCLITFLGSREIYKDAIRKNGWKNEEEKKESFSAFWVFFVPVINVMAVILVFVMAGMTKEKFDQMVEEMNNK